MLILLSVGAVCASDNNQSDSSAGSVSEIADLIDHAQDNGTVNLEKEKYTLESNQTFIINKSVTVNALDNGTVIEGNNNCLKLDAYEKVLPKSENMIIIGPDDGIKNTGKHLIFNNITFKNIRLETWHETEFNGCIFENATFISQELDNRFRDCIINNSIMELIIINGYYFNKFSPASTVFYECNVSESEIRTRNVYTPRYIHLVGGDFFRVSNNVDFGGCDFTASKLIIDNSIINMSKCVFDHTDISGHSNMANIKNCSFSQQNTDFTICKTNVTDCIVNACSINLRASYFSIGSLMNFKNTSFADSKITLTPGFRSRPSNINFTECLIEDSCIDSEDAHVGIYGSTLNMTGLVLSFSDLTVIGTTLYGNGTIENAIKTKTHEEREVYRDGNYTTEDVEYQIKTDYSITDTYFINSTGKYEVLAEYLNKNTLYDFRYISQAVFYVNNELTFVLKDCNGKPICGMEIFIDIIDKYVYPTPSVITDENGTARYVLSSIGNLNINAYYYTAGVKFENIRHDMNINITVRPVVDDLKVIKYEFNDNAYSNIRAYLKLKAGSRNFKNPSDTKITVKIGKKTYTLKTDSAGNAVFKIPEGLSAGKYKLKISVINAKITKTVQLKIKKAKTITKIAKKSNYFNVIVKNKITKHGVSKVKVKIKVYSAKKFKTYSVKTNKKGIAKISTKKLKAGKHKVVVSSGNKNYVISAKSTISVKSG